MFGQHEWLGGFVQIANPTFCQMAKPGVHHE